MATKPIKYHNKNIKKPSGQEGHILPKTLQHTGISVDNKRFNKIIPFSFSNATIFAKELPNLCGDALTSQTFSLPLFLQYLRTILIGSQINNSLFTLLESFVLNPTHLVALKENQLLSLRRKIVTLFHCLALSHSLKHIIDNSVPDAIYISGSHLNKVHSFLLNFYDYTNTTFYQQFPDPQKLLKELDSLNNLIKSLQKITFHQHNLISNLVVGAYNTFHTYKLPYSVFYRIIFTRTFILKDLKKDREYKHDFDLINKLLVSFDLNSNTYPASFLSKDPINRSKVIGLITNINVLLQVFYFHNLFTDQSLIFKSWDQIFTNYKIQLSRCSPQVLDNLLDLESFDGVSIKVKESVFKVLTSFYFGLLTFLNFHLNIESFIKSSKIFEDLSADQINKIAASIETHHGLELERL